MKKRQWIAIFFAYLIASLVLAACGGGADYDIRGAWEYTMLDTDGNVFDEGTISFSGGMTEGTYVEVNTYAIEYEGEYRVKGSSLSLTGYETWRGTIEDANTMSGAWEHDDGFSGTFTAARR